VGASCSRVPIKKKRRTRRPISPGTYALFFLFFAVVVFLSHATFLDLPFYWDEIGQFVPAALDLFHSGALIPRSVTPNAHPPGVMAYLAAIWTVTGYSIVSTRAAMLLLATLCVLVVFLLAIKLCSGVKGAPAFAVVLLLIGSPIFYAQAMLAQLDMPAMLFTVLAVTLFLEERIFLSAIICVALVLVKETGVLTPLLFGFWLLAERRLLQAGYFLLPAAALGCWLLLLHHQTGHLFGSSGFTQYNVQEMQHPVRIGFALAKRLYHLFWENLHWIGALGILYAWICSDLFEARSWRIAWTLVGFHVALFSVIGGAMLERYLLPVLPIVYIGMVAGLCALPSPWRALGQVALIVGVAVCNFWNPPYPFPYENNLAFTDFVKLQQTAAGYIEQNYPGAEVSTAWPLSAALARPEFGYVTVAHRVREIRDFSESAVAGLESAPVEVFVLYSQQWDPPGNLLRNVIVMKIWSRFFSFRPQVGSLELDQRFHLKTVAAWSHAGQWAEVHAR
jgi:4-amino-4-deoxy-L-arabinose transferase-like glycosyltransferase